MVYIIEKKNTGLEKTHLQLTYICSVLASVRLIKDTNYTVFLMLSLTIGASLLHPMHPQYGKTG